MIDVLNYSKLSFPKQFTKYKLNHFDSEEWAHASNYQFEESHVNGDLFDSPPVFNPFGKAVFYDIKWKYDIYRPTISISRGCLIKKHLYDTLSAYNLAPHVALYGGKRIYQDIVHEDLIFLYFYNDYSQRIDYSKSIYWLLREGYDTRNREKETMEDYLLEDDIRLSGLEEWNQKSIFYWKGKQQKLRIKYLHCPEAMQYDMFGFGKGFFHRGIYISKKLKQDLLKMKVKGLKFARNMYFDFMLLE